MIRVLIDLVSLSTGSRGKTLYGLHIINDGTGTQEIGNYDVTAYDGDGMFMLQGRIEGFERTERDALELVRCAIAALPGGD